MSKFTQNFFEDDAATVAKGLLGATITFQFGDKTKKYTIISTEAYYHDECDDKGKKICYGSEKTKAEAQDDVSAPLFSTPGTWCVYGGQLLLSVTDHAYSDNVLIKKIQNENGVCFGPDGIAKELHLYKSKPDYCDCHGKFSLCGCNLLLTDKIDNPSFITDKRVNIASDAPLKFDYSAE
jgi:3-methyladenine DNA glycosylase Mpg